jgi:hypothetical protein
MLAKKTAEGETRLECERIRKINQSRTVTRRGSAWSSGVSRSRRSHSLQAWWHCNMVHGSLSYAHLPTKQMKPNPEPLFSQFKSALRRIAGLGYVLNWRLSTNTLTELRKGHTPLSGCIVRNPSVTRLIGQRWARCGLPVTRTQRAPTEHSTSQK